MKNSKDVLQLKITLIGLKPPIWRRLLVPADYSFFDLHVALQDTFGWFDCHLHQFFTENPYKRTSRWQHIAFPMPEMEDVIDERETKLYDWFKNIKDLMWYEYDFGDSWMHEIKLEKILASEVDVAYPQLLDGARACPPEDCGGIGGYQDLLDVLANPKDREYANMLEWLGISKAEEFDPEGFNKDNVNFRDPKKILREFEEKLDI